MSVEEAILWIIGTINIVTLIGLLAGWLYWRGDAHDHAGFSKGNDDGQG